MSAVLKRIAIWIAAFACAWGGLVDDVVADDIVLITAGDGVKRAAEAAKVWADDATLVYVENDDALNADGKSARWGFLYRSESRRASRAYSVADKGVVLAETFDVRFDPPAMSTSFVDSDRARRAAHDAAGSDFVKRYSGRVETMLLMRGVFHDGDPNATTWTVIYSAEGVPSLYVVVDAESGDVARTWRG